MERFRKANGVHVRQLTKLWHDHGNHGADALFDTDVVLANGNSIAGSPQTVRDLLVEKWPERYQSMPLAGALRKLHTTARVYKDATTLYDPMTGAQFETLLPRS